MANSDASTLHPPRSILVAVELREHGGAAAVATAAGYAAALGAEVILAGIAPLAEPVLATGPSGMGPPMVAAVPDQTVLDRLAREQLAEAAAHVPDGVACRTVLTWGALGPALVDMARRERVDLIAVPIRRAGPIGHLVHDGADRYVLHHSPVPVLVVPAGDHAARAEAA